MVIQFFIFLMIMIDWWVFNANFSSIFSYIVA
jgi:hypothetical protein